MFVENPYRPSFEIPRQQQQQTEVKSYQTKSEISPLRLRDPEPSPSYKQAEPSPVHSRSEPSPSRVHVNSAPAPGRIHAYSSDSAPSRQKEEKAASIQSRIQQLNNSKKGKIKDRSIFIGGLGLVKKAIGHILFSAQIIIELFSTSALIGKYFLFVFSQDRTETFFTLKI